MIVCADRKPERLMAVSYGLVELRELLPNSAAPGLPWQAFAASACGDARDALRQALGMGRVR